MATVTAADSALAVAAASRLPTPPRGLTDQALALDAGGPGVRALRVFAADIALGADAARQGHHPALAAAAHDNAHATDAAESHGPPRAFETAFAHDRAINGVPRPFTFDAAFARDVAHVRSPFVHTRAADHALARDQGAGVVHRAPPPVIPVGETPLFLVATFATGPTARAPLTLAALRDRLEGMELELARQQANRFSLGPQDNQHAVPVHALANAQAMGNASDQHHPTFNATTGQYEPSGPVHVPGPALAGSLPPGPPYGFVSVVQTGSFTGVIQGGVLQVPFQDDAGNPIPFGNGVMGLVISVGDTERNL